MNLYKLILLLMLSGCIVEAGNPNGDTKENAKINISISAEDANIDSNIGLIADLNLTLNVEKMLLLGYDKEGNKTENELELIEKSIEISDPNETIKIAQSNIKAGFFDALVIFLNRDQPAIYKDSDGNVVPLKFEKEDDKAMIVKQEIQISENSEEDVLIQLNIASSIIKRSNDYIFKPQLRNYSKKQTVRVAGQIDERAIVCAYVYEPIIPKRPDFAPVRTEFPKFGPVGQSPKVYKTKDDILFDVTLPCKGAFAQRRVEDDGQFLFQRLIPGKYIFRAFYFGGRYEDISKDHFEVQLGID